MARLGGTSMPGGRLPSREHVLSTDVFDLFNPGLKIVLSGALPRLFADWQAIFYMGIRLCSPEGDRLMNVTVLVIANKRGSASHALITLEEDGGADGCADPLSVNSFVFSQSHQRTVQLTHTASTRRFPTHVLLARLLGKMPNARVPTSPCNLSDSASRIRFQ